MKECYPRRGEDYYPLGFSHEASPADNLPRLFRNFQNEQMGTARFFRGDASKKSENGKSLENLKIENTRLLR